MELKICCDASVKLEKMSNVMEVDCSVGDYQVDGDTLNGNIVIKGKYIRDVIEELHDFMETVPFTLVFKDHNYQVNTITIQDFTCQEIINNGIECNFNIIVNYDLKEVTNKSEKEISNEDIFEDSEKEELEIHKQEEDIIIEKELAPEEIQEELNDDEIKKEINKKYDDLLNEILETRADDNFLEEPKKVTIRSAEEKRDCKRVFTNFKEAYTNYRVYYTNKESDIEKICKLENVSIDKVYKDNRDSNIINKKRIIIK